MVDTYRDQFSPYDASQETQFAGNTHRFRRVGRKWSGMGGMYRTLPRIRKTCLQREKERLLSEAIRELRPTIRQAVEFQLRELSTEEIAGMTGVSVTAAKGRLFHGRRALRKAFSSRREQTSTGGQAAIFDAVARK